MSGSPIVLLVDDDEDHLFFAERALTKAGIRARLCMARSAQEALRVLDQETAPGGPRGTVALVMLDLRMPGMGGMEMLRRLRADDHLRAIPVVVISSSDRPEEVREAYARGANSYVVKRYGGDPGAYLVDVVRYWVDLNQRPEGRGAPSPDRL